MRFKRLVKDGQDLLIYLVGILLVLYGLAYGGIYLNAQRQCLRCGWKEAKVTWALEAFCVREENEYEIVRLLGDACDRGSLEGPEFVRTASGVFLLCENVGDACD